MSCNTSMVELKFIMFISLYVWMAAHNSPLFSNFPKFYGFVFFFLLVGCLTCILHVCLGVAPSELSNKIELLIKNITNHKTNDEQCTKQIQHIIFC